MRSIPSHIGFLHILKIALLFLHKCDCYYFQSQIFLESTLTFQQSINHQLFQQLIELDYIRLLGGETLLDKTEDLSK